MTQTTLDYRRADYGSRPAWEAIYGECWRKLARSEGHFPIMPPPRGEFVRTPDQTEHRNVRLMLDVMRYPQSSHSDRAERMGILFSSIKSTISTMATRGLINRTPGTKRTKHEGYHWRLTPAGRAWLAERRGISGVPAMGVADDEDWQIQSGLDARRGGL